MRILITLVLIANFLSVAAQDENVVSKNALYIDDLPFNEAGKLVFQEVVTADQPKDKLYLLAKMFFTKVFKSADAVIQFDDRESATVVGKGFSEISIETGFSPLITRMFYTITVQCKDKRYRYEITDIYFKSYPTVEYPSMEITAEQMFLKTNYYKRNGKPRPLIESYHQQTLEAVTSLLSQLVDVMNFTKPVDDW